ncbi:14412_t:CDS:2 [Racocetra fulgida]|uniref:14412_t:CDS:1 n=1 Tax=Racocetra fulgida TaxID=60492 RepID=A0A9N9G102_9GLOM|nr:14412_t:CDS:2 [Racocetra fulgida]
MVNANEWLNKKIPTNERGRAETLNIYSKCQCKFENILQYGQPATNSPSFEPFGAAQLDLNDFVNLKKLFIEGIEQNNQQQKLTKLKVDKCIQLTDITIKHTTLGFISIGSKPNLQYALFSGNKQISFCDRVFNYRGVLNNQGDNVFNSQEEILKKQVARLTSLIQSTKATNLNNLKSELKKIKEETFEYQLKIIKSRLNDDYQFWLESLVEAHQEVLKVNSPFARKQLEQSKKKLAEVLTGEEIQDILGKKVEINELETQLNNIKKSSSKKLTVMRKRS